MAEQRSRRAPGPYKLVSFTKDVEAVLERNAGYWGQKPYFAKVIFKHVPNGTTQREMVERGDADIAQDFDADIVAPRSPRAPRSGLVEGLSMNQVYMALTNSAELCKELSDRRVRQAVSYAIDYDGIIKGLVRGAGEQPPAMIPLGLLGGDKTMARKRDVAKAKQLLAEAGYPNGVALKMTYWTRPLLGVAHRAAGREAPGRPRRGRHQGHAGPEGALGGDRRVPGREDPAHAGVVVAGLPGSGPVGRRLLPQGRPGAEARAVRERRRSTTSSRPPRRSRTPRSARRSTGRSTRSSWRTCRTSC